MLYENHKGNKHNKLIKGAFTPEDGHAKKYVIKRSVLNAKGTTLVDAGKYSDKVMNKVKDFRNIKKFK